MLQATLDARVDDDTVTLTFEIRNGGADAETLDFASAQQYELEIHDESGAPVWRWGAERMFAQMLCSRTLGPADRWTIVERWSATARGRLRARGSIASASHRVESSVTFHIP